MTPIQMMEALNVLAFPQHRRVGELEVHTGGLTKREYFAALAMQNLQNVYLRKSNQELYVSVARKYGIDPCDAFIAGQQQWVIAKEAVSQADELMEALREVQ